MPQIIKVIPFLTLGLAVAAGMYCGQEYAKRRTEIGEHVDVPFVSAPLTLDGELVEPSWHATPVIKLLKRDGSDGRPYSDVRFLWNDRFLYIGFYASDHDIVSAGVGTDGPVWLGDSFHIVFTEDGVERSIDVGITGSGGIVTDGKRTAQGAWSYAWQSGARVATDTDGTVDHPGDNDEEWVVEMEVPLASLDLKPSAGTHTEVRVRRCDVTTRGAIAGALCSETKNLVLAFER